MNDSNEEIKQLVHFKFIGIELISSGLNVPQDLLESITEFAFEITTEIQLNPENRFILIKISVQIFKADKIALLGNIAVSHIFQIDNYEEIVKPDSEGRILIPDNLVITLNSVSLSTTRGIMWNTFKGTLLHNAILPILDPKQILNKSSE